MKNELASWLESSSLTVDADTLELRMAGVNAVASTANRASLELLSRVAFKLKLGPLATTATELRGKLSGDGGSLGEEEFRVLAAAALVAVSREKGAVNAVACTQIGTAAFAGLRRPELPMDLAEMGKQARAALSEASRRRPPLTLGKTPPTTIDATSAMAKARASDWNQVAEAFQEIAAGCSSVINSLFKRQALFEQTIHRYISIQDEELDMLWWLQGGRSSTLDLPFEDVPSEQRPFILARELAWATYALPGAASVAPLLISAGVQKDATPISVTAAVKALPQAWLQETLDAVDAAKVSPATTPLHEAFKRCLEVEGADNWMPVWTTVCELPSSPELTPLQLADQCYCEHLLLQH